MWRQQRLHHCRAGRTGPVLRDGAARRDTFDKATVRRHWTGTGVRNARRCCGVVAVAADVDCNFSSTTADECHVG